MHGWDLRGKGEHEADWEHREPKSIPIYTRVNLEQVHWL